MTLLYRAGSIVFVVETILAPDIILSLKIRVRYSGREYSSIEAITSAFRVKPLFLANSSRFIEKSAHDAPTSKVGEECAFSPFY